VSDASAVPGVRRFRDTIGLFATGVAVIVAHTDKEVVAMTANAVSSVSLDPMLVMFCPAKQSNMARHLSSLTGFTVNILRHEQQALSTYFAGGWTQSVPPPFRLIASRYAPRLEGSLASIECAPWKTLEMGDHWLVFGQVVGLRTGTPPYDPLVFLSGQYRQVQTATSAPAPDLSDVRNEPAHIYYE
jgi:flavin reductase (DIM6/NTAB) family NADH-FMN oxidoreductase RutF